MLPGLRHGSNRIYGKANWDMLQFARGAGLMRGVSKSTTMLIKYAYQILKINHPMTLRQLHYAIFSLKEIGYKNDQAHYKKLSRITTYARRLHREWELGPGVTINMRKVPTGKPPELG